MRNKLMTIPLMMMMIIMVMAMHTRRICCSISLFIMVTVKLISFFFSTQELLSNRTTFAAVIILNRQKNVMRLSMVSLQSNIIWRSNNFEFLAGICAIYKNKKTLIKNLQNIWYFWITTKLKKKKKKWITFYKTFKMKQISDKKLTNSDKE